MMHADVKYIIYDPISWIHPKRFSLPQKLATARCRSIINDIILHQYGLSTGDLDLSNSKENYLAHHWTVLAKAAFMAACHRYRSALAYNGLMFKLDPLTFQFTQCELTGSRDDFRGDITWGCLRFLAYRELMTFSSDVSLLMKERIPLLFEKQAEVNMSDSFILQQNDNEILVRMAIQYAKRNH